MIMDKSTGNLDTNDVTFMTNKAQVLWLLKVISESNNIRGSDLNVAVKTIAGLQQLIKE